MMMMMLPLLLLTLLKIPNFQAPAAGNAAVVVAVAGVVDAPYSDFLKWWEAVVVGMRVVGLPEQEPKPDQVPYCQMHPPTKQIIWNIPVSNGDS